MQPSSSAEVVSIDVRLRPDELVGAWRTDSRRLVLQTREPVRVQQRIAARITAVDRSVAATITGRVASASRDGTVHRIELVPDQTRLRALEQLLAVARGQKVQYQTRIPRLLATIPAVVHGPAGPIYMTTFSVSENGCGLAWSGPAPAVVGTELDIRLGAGGQAVVFRGVVCWTAKSGNTATVGVRFVAGAAKHAWAMMLMEAKRSGAPPA
jgi:hypothetical protein